MSRKYERKMLSNAKLLLKFIFTLIKLNILNLEILIMRFLVLNQHFSVEISRILLDFFFIFRIYFQS